MEEQNTKYNAFISYRHAELDKYVAENLHRLIETYIMPKQVVEKYNITDNNIRRIFRDQEELPLSSNLQDPIYDALSKSKFLIVICSPRLKESKWCKKEIQTFIKMHGRQNILCVLIEGEPNESFPEELLFYKEKVKTKTGKERTKKIPCEPLAMDVRGNSKQEVYKKLKAELIRIIAPMYNLDYDDIKRRHEERELKKKVKTFRLITIISIIFALYSAMLFFKIYMSSKQLKYDQAINLAMLSSESLAKDDRDDAIEKAYQSVTKYNNITPKGIYELTESLGVYYTPISFNQIGELNTRGIVESIKTDSKLNYLLSTDNSDELVLWNLKNRKRIKTITDIDSTINKNRYSFINNGYIYQNSKEDLIIENLNGKKIKTIKLNQRIDNIIACENYIAISIGKKLHIYDINTYKEIATYESSYKIYLIYFDEKGENILIYTSKELTDKNNELITYNIKEKSPKAKINTNGVVKILFNNDDAIVLARDSVNLISDMIVTNYNYKTGKIKYQKRFEQESPTDISMKYTKENKTILASSRLGGTHLLDYETGKEKASFIIGGVRKSYQVTNSNIYRLFTESGNTHNIDSALSQAYNDDNNVVITGLYNFNLKRYEDYLYTNEGMVTYIYDDNRILIYGHLKNKDMKEIEYKEKIKPYETNKKDKIIEEYDFKNKNFIDYLTYSNDKKLLFVSYKNNTLEIYDNKTKKLIKTIEDLKNIDKYLGKNNDYHIIKGDDGYILDENLDVIARIPKLYDYKNNKLILLSSGKYYEVKIYNKKEIIEIAKKIREG